MYQNSRHLLDYTQTRPLAVLLPCEGIRGNNLIDKLPDSVLELAMFLCNVDEPC